MLSLTWHRWFAWHPVRANGSWVWLRVIERHFEVGLKGQRLKYYRTIDPTQAPKHPRWLM